MTLPPSRRAPPIEQYSMYSNKTRTVNYAYVSPVPPHVQFNSCFRGAPWSSRSMLCLWYTIVHATESHVRRHGWLLRHMSHSYSVRACVSSSADRTCISTERLCSHSPFALHFEHRLPFDLQLLRDSSYLNTATHVKPFILSPLVIHQQPSERPRDGSQASLGAEVHWARP